MSNMREASAADFIAAVEGTPAAARGARSCLFALSLPFAGAPRACERESAGVPSLPLCVVQTEHVPRHRAVVSQAQKNQGSS